MSTCVTLPTLTTVSEEVRTDLVGTEIVTTTTLPPTLVTTTISTDICSTNTTAVPPRTSCTPVFTTSVETIPGPTSVITLASDGVVTTTISHPVTLFTTSCTGTTPDPPSPRPDTTTPTSTPTSSTTSTYTTVSNTTLPNGAVSTVTHTMTSVGLPSPTTQSNNSNDTGSGTNVAPIVGGVVGGLVGLAALGMLAWYFFKKSTYLDRKFNAADDFEPTHHNDKTGPLADEVNGKGYQYGLVGQETGGPPSGGQEVGFKGAGGNEVGGYPTGNETGYQPNVNETGYYQPTGNEVGPYQPTGNEVYHGGNETGYQDANHVRTPSLAPLLAGLGASAAGSAAGATAQSASGSSRPPSSGRPSTGGSTYPLIPQGQQQQQQGYPPQGYGGQGLTAYPPSSSQSYGGSQGYYGSDHGHSYGGSASGHSTNPSMGSWNGGPAQSHNNMVPVMVGGNRTSYIDPEHRTGSPVSIQEHRVLQVINPDNSYTYSSGGGASSAVAGGSSSSAAAYASSAAGSSSAAAPAVDGKGRPINLGGEKAPLVHLDGGRYEESHVPAGGPSSSSNEPAPPAYSS